MSNKKGQHNKNAENISENELDKEEIEEEPPKIIKKRKRKSKIISEAEIGFEADEEKLIFEITNLLKRARAAIAEEKYIEAIKCYQDASIAASMIGDTEREKIYLTRANEILQEHPELKEKGIEILKKRKIKAKIREQEEKFSIGRLIFNLLVATIFIFLIYSGIFSALILEEVFEMGGSYNLNFLWGICILIEITGIILAYLLGRYCFRWLE